MKSATSCCILLLLRSIGFAQNNETDSLMRLLSVFRQDTSRVLIMAALAGNYFFGESNTTGYWKGFIEFV